MLGDACSRFASHVVVPVVCVAGRLRYDLRDFTLVRSLRVLVKLSPRSTFHPFTHCFLSGGSGGSPGSGGSGGRGGHGGREKRDAQVSFAFRGLSRTEHVNSRC